MALYVNTNISSINAQRKMTNAVNNLNTSYQRLSSGLRINSARDDAAGLQISDRLTSQINGLNQGNRNANDGIALAQTIEGALDESCNMLQRIRTLAIQAANGTNTDSDRAAIQLEVTQLSHEITRIAKKTTYAGAQVLDGGSVGIPHSGKTDGFIDFQVGSNANDTISLDVSSSFTLTSLMTASGFLGKTTLKVSWVYDKKITSVPINPAAPVGDVVQYQKWEDVTAGNDACGLVITHAAKGAALGAAAEARWSVSTATLAQLTLANIDKAIGFIDSKRAEFGAIQNRMEATIRNQANISENESDARSRIRDTDFAAETAAMTQGNIIQQASQTILAQANQRPQIALQLLGQ